jgi:DNA-binding transcriptional ArsR family regulator
VSRHLRVLREAGLVGEEQVPEDRRVRLYRLEHEALDELSAWLSELSHGWQRQLLVQGLRIGEGSRGHSARRRAMKGEAR